MEKPKYAPRELTMIGLMSAAMCVLAPVSIPLPGLVPVSLGLLVVYFYPYLLGTKRAALSCLLYIVLGVVGLPVFSGYTSGLPKLVGPTGGYILGYFIVIFFLGEALRRFPTNRFAHAAGIALGTICLYVIGTLWLAHVTGRTFDQALAAGVIPFIPGDIAKAVAAMVVAPAICSRLRKAGLMPQPQA